MMKYKHQLRIEYHRIMGDVRDCGSHTIATSQKTWEVCECHPFM